jgi:hypothetical protein
MQLMPEMRRWERGMVAFVKREKRRSEVQMRNERRALADFEEECITTV